MAGNLDLGSFICVHSPDMQTVKIGSHLTAEIPTDYFREKYKAAKGVPIEGWFLHNSLLMGNKKKLGSVIRKICKYHDRFDTWPPENLMWRFIFQQSRFGRYWLTISDSWTTFVHWLDLEKPISG